MQASSPSEWRARALVRLLFLTVLLLLISAGVWQVPLRLYLPYYGLSLMFLAGVLLGKAPTGLHRDQVQWLLDLVLLAGLIRYTGGSGSPFTALAYVWVFGMLVVHFRRGLRLPVVSFPLSALVALGLGGAGRPGWLAHLATQAVALALITLIGAHLLQERSRGRTDALTGVLTRSAGLELLTELQAHQRTFHVAFADIRNFKHVNDQHGHLVGDEVLAALGARLVKGLRSDEYVMRYGGDEFIVVSPHRPMARHVQRAVAWPVSTKVGAIRLQADVGEVVGRSGRSLDALLHEADERMYHRKGRPLGWARSG